MEYALELLGHAVAIYAGLFAFEYFKARRPKEIEPAPKPREGWEDAVKSGPLPRKTRPLNPDGEWEIVTLKGIAAGDNAYISKLIDQCRSREIEGELYHRGKLKKVF